MLSGGIRLALLVAAPLLGALAVHELRAHMRAALLVACGAVAACAGLALSLAGGVDGGGSVDRTFGTALPGVDLTARADSASIAIILVSAIAAVLALPRARVDHERLSGLLLCLAGSAAVAVAGNLVLESAGVELTAAGVLLVGGRHGPGFRSKVLVTAVIAAAGLSLVAVAGQLVAQVGSSDLSAIPPQAVGGAVAVPWALAGAVLLLSPLILVSSASGTREWAAVAAVPTGYLVLLRLEQTGGGSLPGNAAVMVGVIGALTAVVGARAALRAAVVGDAAWAAVGVVTGLLVSTFGGSLSADGFAVAGLFLGVELALMASPSWTRVPSGWSAPVGALIVLPGSATAAAALVSLGSVVGRGPTAFLQVAVFAGALAAAAAGVARCLVAPPPGWRPAHAGALLAVVAGLAGGLVPGAALRLIAAPLAGGAQSIAFDAAALQHPGADWAGGYYAAALLVVLGAITSAMVLAGEGRPARPTPTVAPPTRLHLALLLRPRRRFRGLGRRAWVAVHAVDQWLDVQPQLALVAVTAAVALFVVH